MSNKTWDNESERERICRRCQSHRAGAKSFDMRRGIRVASADDDDVDVDDDDVRGVYGTPAYEVSRRHEYWVC